MLEEMIKSNTARISTLEGDVKGLAITLERVATEQDQHTRMLCAIEEATTRRQGWIKQAVNPQSVLIVVVFLSSLFGVNLVWPSASPVASAVELPAGE